MTGIAFPVPDAEIMGRRDAIIAGLAGLVAPEALITTEDERRAFETDALTAYRRMPLAVVLPTSTEEVAAVLSFCNENGVKVVPRGAGTSLAGGAIPQEDAIVLGVAKMNQVLDIDFADRTARVQSGITNLAISQAVVHEGFFYAPDPSSPARLHDRRQHRHEFGRRALPEIRRHHQQRARRAHGDARRQRSSISAATHWTRRATICSASSSAPRGSSASSPKRPSASSGRRRARARAVRLRSSEQAGAVVAAIIGAGIVPVAMEFMDKPAIEICEAFAHAGYPLDVEALLIIEVEGSDAEMDASSARIVAIARAHRREDRRESKSAMESAAIWKGRKSAFGATGRVADYICMDGTIPTGPVPYVLKRMDEIVKCYGLSVANVFHAGDGNLHPLIMYNVNDPVEAQKAEDAGNDILKLCVEVGGCLTGEHGVGIEKRDLMRHQFTQDDLEQQMRVRAVFDRNG